MILYKYIVHFYSRETLVKISIRCHPIIRKASIIHYSQQYSELHD